MKRRRWLLRLVLGLLAVILLIIFLAPFIPLSPLKPMVESRLSARLNREVRVSSIHLDLVGGPYLVMRDFTAKMSPELGDGNLLEAKQIKVNLAATAILRREVVIEGAELEAATFTLVKDRTGTWHWNTLSLLQSRQNLSDDDAIAAEPMTASLLTAASPFNLTAKLALTELKLKDSAVKLQDHSKGQPTESLYQGIQLTAKIKPLAESQAASDPSGQKRQLVGTLRVDSSETESEPANLLKVEMPFDLTLNSGATEPRLQGRLGHGQVETSFFTAQDFSATVKLENHLLTLEQMEVKPAEGTMRGQMSLNLATSQYTAQGTLDKFKLAPPFGAALGLPDEIVAQLDSEFDVTGEWDNLRQAVLTARGRGRLISASAFIPNINVSEQVARVLRLDELGDMRPGTAIAGISGEFQLEQGIVRTERLSVAELDGLGQATIEQGWIQLATPPTVNYTATVELSSEATSRIRSANTLLGAVTALLARNSRLTVPVSITGDISNPHVKVDTSRLF